MKALYAACLSRHYSLVKRYHTGSCSKDLLLAHMVTNSSQEPVGYEDRAAPLAYANMGCQDTVAVLAVARLERPSSSCGDARDTSRSIELRGDIHLQPHLRRSRLWRLLISLPMQHCSSLPRKVLWCSRRILLRWTRHLWRHSLIPCSWKLTHRSKALGSQSD